MLNDRGEPVARDADDDESQGRGEDSPPDVRRIRIHGRLGSDRLVGSQVAREHQQHDRRATRHRDEFEIQLEALWMPGEFRDRHKPREDRAQDREEREERRKAGRTHGFILGDIMRDDGRTIAQLTSDVCFGSVADVDSS